MDATGLSDFSAFAPLPLIFCFGTSIGYRV
jgi:hypothetical protein